MRGAICLTMALLIVFAMTEKGKTFKNTLIGDAYNKCCNLKETPSIAEGGRVFGSMRHPAGSAQQSTAGTQ